MKIIAGIVIGLGIIAGLFFLISDSSPSESSSANDINFTTIQSDLDKGSLLVDVRTAEEYTVGHIDKSVNLPLADIQTGIMPNSDKSQVIYVYCRSGNRSTQAKNLLEKAGFTNVIDLGAMTSVLAIGGTEVR